MDNETNNNSFEDNEFTRPDDLSNPPAIDSTIDAIEFNEIYTQLKHKLLGAFNELIGLQKDVLKLFLEGHDNEEIGEILKKDASNVSSTKENAIKNLRKKVSPLKLKGNNKNVAILLRDFYNDNL